MPGPTLLQLSIRQKKRRIELEIEIADRRVDLAKEKLEDLKEYCQHPEMEDFGTYAACPDCGYSDSR